MLYYCSSLESIDISNFDIRNCDSIDSMFELTDNLIFINLYNFIYSNNYISLLFSEINCPFVCQKDNIIIHFDTFNCCDVNLETRQCESDLSNIPQNETNVTNIEITNTIATESNLDYSTNRKSSGGISIGIIIGIIAGGVVVISIIIVIIIYCYRKNKKNKNRKIRLKIMTPQQSISNWQKWKKTTEISMKMNMNINLKNKK